MMKIAKAMKNINLSIVFYMNTKNDISLLENTQIRMLFCFVFKFICSMCMILYAKKDSCFFQGLLEDNLFRVF